MTQYLISWISVAVLSALAEFLAPGGKNGKLTGYIRYVAGLCILVALIPAVAEGVHRFKNMSELDNADPLDGEAYAYHQASFQNYLSDLTREEYEGWVYRTLDEVFDISKENCRITVIMDANGAELPVLEEISIGLSGKAVLVDPQRIESYITDRLSAVCTVYVM